MFDVVSMVIYGALLKTDPGIDLSAVFSIFCVTKPLTIAEQAKQR